MQDYMKYLRDLRQKFQQDTVSVDKAIENEAAQEQQQFGLLQRQQPKQKLQQPQEEPLKPFESWIKDLNNIRKRIKEQAAPTDFSLPKREETRTYKPQNYSQSFGVPQLSQEEVKQKVASVRAEATRMPTAIPKDVNNDKAFMMEVNRLANKFGWEPNDLLAVMSFETGGSFDPAKRNKVSGATGLIQFIPETAKGLGVTTEELSKMTRAEQMKYVEKYFNQFGNKVKGLGVEDLYLAVLNPSFVGKPKETPMWRQGSVQYAQNSGLDINKDGIITKGEAAEKAVGLMKRRVT